MDFLIWTLASIVYSTINFTVMSINLLILLDLTFCLPMVTSARQVCAVGCEPARWVKYFCSNVQ